MNPLYTQDKKRFSLSEAMMLHRKPVKEVIVTKEEVPSHQSKKRVNSFLNDN
jgi:hypothetical protein